jgi:hypothetical protein
MQEAAVDLALRDQLTIDLPGTQPAALADPQGNLQQRDQPIWRSLTSNRAELFREVDGVAQVQAAWLEQRFGRPGPFWCRHYRFFRAGQPLTVIREVFSPALEHWLGAADDTISNRSSPALAMPVTTASS